MAGYFITKYKTLRQERFLQQSSGYKKGYAIVGTGQHGFTNLYPCLWHLGVPVKAIWSRTLTNAQLAAARWNNCIGTSDINTILNDEGITGVIVAVPPARQASMVLSLLQAGKQVFAEKPVGASAAELKQLLLSAGKHRICQIGLQRRFAPMTDILRKQCTNVLSYHYRFLLGAYPEGNCVYDLFIHPVDFVTQVFGPPAIEHISKRKDNAGVTYFITLAHGDIKGSLELSTHYSWQQPVDEICVNTKSKTFTARYPDYVAAVTKPARLLSVPMEKLLPRPLQQQVYLDSSFLPSPAMSSLYLQGFYPQLKHFADTVEKNRPGPLSSLESLLPVYEILDCL